MFSAVALALRTSHLSAIASFSPWDMFDHQSAAAAFFLVSAIATVSSMSACSFSVVGAVTPSTPRSGLNARWPGWSRSHWSAASTATVSFFSTTS